MSRASRTRRVRRSAAIAQPTMRRDQASSTMARNRKPAAVGTQVMSATHSRFGPGAVKTRPTRSLAGVCIGSRRVVVGYRRRETPRRSNSRSGGDARRYTGLERARQSERTESTSDRRGSHRPCRATSTAICGGLGPRSAKTPRSQRKPRSAGIFTACAECPGPNDANRRLPIPLATTAQQ